MNTKSFRTLALGPLLFAAVVGLGLALSGCVVDTTPNGGYGYGCQSDLFVDWQIQNVAGGSVTCDAISPAQVVIDIDGVKYPQTCPPAIRSATRTSCCSRTMRATTSRSIWRT